MATRVAINIAMSGVPAKTRIRRTTPSASTPCARAAASISNTGRSMVTIVTPSEGERVLTAEPDSWSAIAPGSMRT